MSMHRLICAWRKCGDLAERIGDWLDELPEPARSVGWAVTCVSAFLGLCLLAFAGYHFVKATIVIVNFVWTLLWDNILSLFPWWIFPVIWPYVRTLGVILIWAIFVCWIYSAAERAWGLHDEVKEDPVEEIISEEPLKRVLEL